MKDTGREREAETQAEGEAGSCRRPDVGLDPGSPGSHPGLQAALNHCATGAAQEWGCLDQPYENNHKKSKTAKK